MTSGGHEVEVGGRRGGGGGGHCPSTNLCAINDRASFLPVKSSTVNLLTSGVLAIVQALDDEV